MNRIAWLAAALMALVLRTGPAQAQERSCVWFGQGSADGAYPDESAYYWGAVVPFPPGGHVEIRARYPYARYTSLHTLTPALQAIDALADVEIAPDAGSSNPFFAGADRMAPLRDYTVKIVNERVPASGRMPNTLYTENADGSKSSRATQTAGLELRVYIPDRGFDNTGGVGYPQVTLVSADGSRTQVPQCPIPAGRPGGDDGTIPDLLSEASFPSVLPAVGLFGENPPRWRKYTNIATMQAAVLIGGGALGALREQVLAATDALVPSGGAAENLHNKYVYTTFSREFGEVLVLRGKLPTTPKTRDGQAVMGSGQLRYWSMCTNGQDTNAYGCAADDQVATDQQGWYAIAVSESLPFAGPERCGVTWLPAGALPQSVLLMRNMLSAPDFEYAIQNVQPGLEREQMAEYLPTGTYYPTAADAEQALCLAPERSSGNDGTRSTDAGVYGAGSLQGRTMLLLALTALLSFYQRKRRERSRLVAPRCGENSSTDRRRDRDVGEEEEMSSDEVSSQCRRPPALRPFEGQRVVLAGLVSLAFLAAAPSASADPLPGCAPPAGGGDWPSYGHDLWNTRSQPLEDQIDAGNVGQLDSAWTFDAPAAELSGVFNSTPIEYGGCLYGTLGGGGVFALNSATGELVWKTTFQATAPLGDLTIIGSPAVDRVDGLGEVLYVAVADVGQPYVVALDRATGQIVWKTVVTNDPGTYIMSSPVVHRQRGKSTVIATWSDDIYDPPYRGGMAFIDGRSGRLLKSTPVIPDDRFAEGYSGGSIWSTGAIEGEHFYIGSGNPSAQAPQDPNTDALLKVDLDRVRPTFGEIVGVYQGTPDQYIAGLNEQPVCENAPTGVLPVGLAWAPCMQFDLDFGASPNLFRDSSGRLIVGDLQKSGVYHAAYADTMEPYWSQVIGAPVFFGNSSSGAVMDGRIFTLSSPPANMVALSTTGSRQWIQPVTTGVIQYQSVSAANGVVYYYDHLILHAFAADSGTPLLKKRVDTGGTGLPYPPSGTSNPELVEASGTSSAGIAIARNTIYVAGANRIVAMRLPGQQEPGSGDDGTTSTDRGASGAGSMQGRTLLLLMLTALLMAAARRCIAIKAR